MNRVHDIPEPSLFPPEPEEVAVCDCCGEAIYAGNSVYVLGGNMVHIECIIPYIRETLTPGEIADFCGFTKAVAGEAS